MKNKIITLILAFLLVATPLISAIPPQIFPNPHNVTTPLQSIKYIVGLTDVNGSGPLFGTVIYFLIVASLFMGMKSFTNDRAFAVAVFIASSIGILLRIFGWTNDYAVYLSLILLVIALFQLVKKND